MRLGRPRPAVLIWVGGMLLAVAWAVPLLWMLSTSLKLPGEVLTSSVEWLPRTVTLGNYAKVFQRPVSPMAQDRA